MTSSIQAAFALVVLLLLFAPAIVLVVASARVLKVVKDVSVVCMAIGAVLLALVSLDFMYSFFVARLFGPTELAAYTLYALYITKAVNCTGLLLIGFGLIRFSRVATLSTQQP